MFGLKPVSGPMSPGLFRRLVAAEQVLFASLDDDTLGFAACAATRSFLARPTAALFLRAQKCFETGRWYYPVKRNAFTLMRRFPKLTIATITPFYSNPEYAEVANTGVCDPQYWDMLIDGKVRSPAGTLLSREIETRANGRKIICALGVLGTGKGFDFLAETLECHSELSREVLVVCAGRTSPASKPIAESLTRGGGFLIDRFITNAELESLYLVSDAIWACYAPEYDQASGIFGRAIQFGVPPVLRSGSLVSNFARHNEIEHIAVDYRNKDQLARALLGLPSKSQRLDDADVRTRRVAKWYSDFEMTIGQALTGRRQAGGGPTVIPQAGP